MVDTKTSQGSKLDPDTVLAELRTRLLAGTLGSCVVCQHTDWTVDDGLAVVDVSSKVGSASDRNSREMYFPLVSLICNNCGNTHFINAKILGVID